MRLNSLNVHFDMSARAVTDATLSVFGGVVSWAAR